MGDWSSVVAAGTGGAIAAAASYLASRTELRRQREVRADERASVERKELLALRRESYTQLFLSARQYRTALLEFISSGEFQAADTSSDHAAEVLRARGKVEATRLNFEEHFSHSMMVAPATVRDRAHPINHALMDMYQVVVKAQGSPDELRTRILETVSRPVWDLGEVMRADLRDPQVDGVS